MVVVFVCFLSDFCLFGLIWLLCFVCFRAGVFWFTVFVGCVSLLFCLLLVLAFVLFCLLLLLLYFCALVCLFAFMVLGLIWVFFVFLVFCW